jgi:hypothetical protein
MWRHLLRSAWERGVPIDRLSLVASGEKHHHASHASNSSRTDCEYHQIDTEVAETSSEIYGLNSSMLKSLDQTPGVRPRTTHVISNLPHNNRASLADYQYGCGNYTYVPYFLTIVSATPHRKRESS